MSGRSIWATLGLTQTRDRTAIRRAYAARLKVTNPEDDPEGFQALRRAYEMALARAAAPESMAPVFEPNGDADLDKDLGSEAPADQDPGQGGRPSDSVNVVVSAPVAPDVSLKPKTTDHERALRALQLAVATGQNVDAVRSALDAVLTSPDLDRLNVYLSTEAWLAELIVRNFPVSDPLAAPTAERFGWTASERDRHVDVRVAAILARVSSLARISAFSQKSNPMHASARMLQVGPTRRSIFIASIIPGRLSNLKELLNVLRRDPYALDYNFSRRIVDNWSAVIEQPRIPAAAVWLTLGLGPIAGGYFDAMFSPRDVQGLHHNSPAFFVWWPALTAAGFAVLAFKLYAFDKPRFLWRTRWKESAGPVLQLGWGVAALVLIPTSSVLPANDLSLAAIAGAALAVLLWASITGDRLSDSSSIYPKPVRWIARNTPLALLWGSILAFGNDPSARQVGLAVAAAGAATVLGEESLRQTWSQVASPTSRTIALALGVLTCLGLLVAVAIDGPGSTSVPLATALSVAALVHRLPASTAPPIREKLQISRHPRLVLLVSIFGAMALVSVGAQVVKASAILVAGGTFFAVGGALRREWRHRMRQRSV